MIGYDFDGVLAELCRDPFLEKSYGKMNGHERDRRKQILLNHYRTAAPILSPVEKEFVVISARKATPDVFSVSRAWLQHHFPHKRVSLFLLPESRSILNVVSFKGSVIRSLGVTDFIEDNVKVVKGLREATSARVWLYRNDRLSLE